MNDQIKRIGTIFLIINKAYLMLLNFFELEIFFLKKVDIYYFTGFLKTDFDHV
jgi:hypothetical protein